MDDGNSSGFKVVLKWFQSGFKVVSNTRLVRKYYKKVRVYKIKLI